jgi:hypothetical protein
METTNSVEYIYTTPKKGISKYLINQKIKYKEHKNLPKSNKYSVNKNVKRNLLDEFK